MVCTLRNHTGDVIPPNGIITEFTVKRETKTSVHKLPGAGKDLIQKMGLSNRIFAIKGFVTNSAGVTTLNDTVNYTGSILYVNILGQTIINNVQVFYTDLQLHDRGLRPFETNFLITAVEII